jgi:hypothetical protein
MTRRPADVAYQSVVLQAAPSPGVGGTVCQIGNRGDAPVVAWFSPIVRVGSPFDQNLYAAVRARGVWNVERLGNNAGEPTSLAVTANGTLLYGSATSGDTVWRTQDGHWSACPVPGGGTGPTARYLTLIHWKEEAALVGYVSYPTGNIVVRGLDARQPDCIAGL